MGYCIPFFFTDYTDYLIEKTKSTNCTALSSIRYITEKTYSERKPTVKEYKGCKIN